MGSGEQIGLSSGGLRLAIIADDLTGALDAAAPFADRGLRVRVATRPEALRDALAGADVVAVSTRSRESVPDAARAAVAAALAELPAGVALFKKVDSRLKGNIAAELAAFAQGPVLAVPALPDFGRVVKGGAVCGWGLAQPIAVVPVLGRAAAVPDVITAEDMAQAIGRAPGHLIVGARGAAQCLAAAAKGRRGPLPALEMPMVVAVGSTDPITLAQVAELRAGAPGLRMLSAPDGQCDALPAPGVTLVQATMGRGAPGPQVAAALGGAVLRLAQGARSLVLTGGATAEAVLDALGVSVLDLHGDLQPGLPLSSGGGWRIVTKSGGFGDAGALLRLARETMGAGA